MKELPWEMEKKILEKLHLRYPLGCFFVTPVQIHKAMRDLADWLDEKYTSDFFHSLFDLFRMADVEQSLKLGAGFPEYYLVFKWWRESESTELFFQEWGLN